MMLASQPFGQNALEQMMPVQVRCQCGKRYRVADDAAGKRLRCKDCGEELVIPRQSPGKSRAPADDDFDSFDIDSPRSVANHFSDQHRLPPRSGRARADHTYSESGDDNSSFGGAYSLSDVIVRGTALFVFLATLRTCAYHLLRANAAPAQGPAEGHTIGAFIWGITPLLVAGPFALYI